MVKHVRPGPPPPPPPPPLSRDLPKLPKKKKKKEKKQAYSVREMYQRNAQKKADMEENGEGKGGEFPADARFSVCFFAQGKKNWKLNVDCFKILAKVFGALAAS